MADIFSLDQLGVRFTVKLIDCISDTLFDVSDVEPGSTFIKFYKPDGSSFQKAAILIPDPENIDEFIIEYINGNDGIPPETVSILDDNTSHWEYAGGGVLTNGDNFQTSQRKVIWVN